MTLSLQLGVDLGTAWSKLVVRHYGATGGDKSYVLEVDGATLVPSLMAWDKDKVFFGRKAEQLAPKERVGVVISPKMAFAYPDKYPWGALALPAGMRVEHVMILLLLHLLDAAHGSSAKIAARVGEKDFFLGMTLGVPMAHLDDGALSQRYQRVAKAAYRVYREAAKANRSVDPNGWPISRAISEAERAWTDEPVAQKLSPQWIRSEASAALQWAFHSPTTRAKQVYFDLDVGAGTASASSFIIEDEHVRGNWVKSSIGYYGASCKPPGGDMLTKMLSDAGKGTPLQLRAMGAGGLDALRADGALQSELVRQFAADVFDGLREAHAAVHRKLNGYGDLSNAGIFIFGGGARSQNLKAAWAKYMWEATTPFKNSPQLRELEPPPDLKLTKSLLNSDTDRFLVAYGLSHFAGDVPLAESPRDFRVVAPPDLRRLASTMEGIYEK